MVQRLNNNRSQLNATKKYKVAGLGDEDVMTENEDSLSSEERLDKTFRDFLSQGREEGDKVQNTRLLCNFLLIKVGSLVLPG